MTAVGNSSVAGLARDSAAELGHVLDLHFEVARLELVAALWRLGRQAAGLVLLCGLAALGYALTIVGLSLWLAGRASLGGPFVGLGLVHLLAAALGLAVGSRIRARASPLPVSRQELRQTLVSLGATVRRPFDPARRAP